MRRHDRRSRSAPAAVGRVAAAALALGLVVGGAACKNKGKGGKTPGGISQEQIDKAVDAAKTQAKVAELIRFANEYLEKGRHKSALKLADDAIKENPNNADAYAVRGAALWRAGDFEGSMEAYGKGVDADKTNYGAAMGMARVLQTTGQHLEAVKVLEDAKALEQTEAQLASLASYYAELDMSKAQKTHDEIVKGLKADDERQKLVGAWGAFINPLADKGPFCVVEGKSGSSDANMHHGLGLKYSGAVVGEDFTRVIFMELREEAIIDDALAKSLKLKSIAKFTPADFAEEKGLVLVPEVKFGDLKLKNVPAIVSSLAPYSEALGETPGLVLGRQALQKIGAVTWDFPKKALTLDKDAPGKAPAGSTELPLLMLSFSVRHAPAVPMQISGSKHRFFVYFGGTPSSGVAVTSKHFFKSGHLPREVEQLDDEESGLKMVYIDSVTVGDKTLGGMGGLVMTKNPPDPNLGLFLQNTGFELGGYINLAAMEAWSVTYSFPQGKVYINPGA